MTTKSQVEKFKQAARELETDNDEAKFNEKLGRIARQVPKPIETDKPITPSK